MTKKDYIKFAQVFKKAFKEEKNQKDTNISTYHIIATILDDTIEIFENDNSRFCEETFRQAISK